MTAEMAASLAAQSIVVAFYLLLPVAAAALLAAVVTAALQAAMQLQDSTISFLPRLLVGGAALLLFGPWMLSVAGGFAGEAWRLIHTIGG